METCEIIVNNHTCEIVDFIGDGNVNKRSIFYNNIFYLWILLRKIVHSK